MSSSSNVTKCLHEFLMLDGRENPPYLSLAIGEILPGTDFMVTVLYTEGWICDVALIEYTLSPGKPKKGWDFRREGTKGQWGTKGVSLQATWD
jgi:hypothetical protein